MLLSHLGTGLSTPIATEIRPVLAQPFTNSRFLSNYCGIGATNLRLSKIEFSSRVAFKPIFDVLKVDPKTSSSHSGSRNMQQVADVC
jgi:hypothetical protein